MSAVDSAMAAGRFGLAARSLEQLLARTPDSGEAAYVLGLCEQARGRSKDADKAWARVRPGSRFSQRAIIARLRLLHDTGQLAAAESLIVSAAEDPRNDRTDVLVLLVPIYSETGRFDEAERLIGARLKQLWEINSATQEESIKLVRLHIELSLRTPSVENVRLYLQQVGQLAPDDDRVWLGRANLAIRTGALEEAGRWLDACQRRRPDDVPVWKARLRWAVAAKRKDVVDESRKRIPATESTPAQVHRLVAWLCAQGGDAACECRELERLIETEPADAEAIYRLVQLATKDGQSARVAELERRKAELTTARARYLELYDRAQPIRDSEEMARLAAQLGRSFEARVFLMLALSEEPDRNDLRKALARLAQ
jgi:enediyne biosynthesis protein E4